MKRFSVSPVDTMVDRFRNTEERLASLERASSSGSGGGGGGADVVEGTTPPSTLPPGSFFFDTDCEPPFVDWQAQIDALDARLDVLEAQIVYAKSNNAAWTAPDANAVTLTGVSGTVNLTAGKLYLAEVWVPYRNGTAQVNQSVVGTLSANGTQISFAQQFVSLIANERQVLHALALWTVPTTGAYAMTVQFSISVGTAQTATPMYGWRLQPVTTV